MKRFKKQILSGLLMSAIIMATGCDAQNQTTTQMETETKLQLENQTNENEQTKSGVSNMIDYGNMKDMTIHTEPIMLTEEWDKSLSKNF